MIMEEIWRKINGFPYYEVSNMGRVRSLDKLVNNRYSTRTRKGKILKPVQTRDGYLSVTLYTESSVYKIKKIHTLVANSFIPKIDGKSFVNHIDHNKRNNTVENLEWCNTSENMKAFNKHVRRDPMFIQHNSTILLNTMTGVFYYSYQEACESVNLSYIYFYRLMSGKSRYKRKLPFVIC